MTGCDFTRFQRVIISPIVERHHLPKFEKYTQIKHFNILLLNKPSFYRDIQTTLPLLVLLMTGCPLDGYLF